MSANSFFGRLIAIFSSPGNAMTAVRERPMWFQVSLVTVLTLGLFSALTAHIAGPEQLEVMRDTRFGSMLTDEQFQEQYNESLDPSTVKRAISGATAGIGVWVFSLLFGLVLLLASKLSGGQATFAQVQGVNFWAGVINALGYLLKIPLVMAKDSVMEASFSLAAFMPEVDVTSGMYVFLTTFTDIFVIWSLVVTIIGFMKVNDFGGGKAAAVVGVPWLLFAGVGFLLNRLFM